MRRRPVEEAKIDPRDLDAPGLAGIWKANIVLKITCFEEFSPELVKLDCQQVE